MSDKIFLDANILVYAHDKDAGEKLLTEDMNSGQIIEGVLIENPFKAQRKYLKPLQR